MADNEIGLKEQQCNALTTTTTTGDQPPAHNFVEISRLPKKIDAKTLTSLVVSATRILPKSSKLCYKSRDSADPELVGLVEFHSEREALRAVDRIRSGPYGQSWNLKLMLDPRSITQESEMLKKWLN